MQKEDRGETADAGLVLVITRQFDAPRERVFDAWLDPAQIAKWIGPRSVKAEALELRPQAGGAYRIDMKGVDGTNGPVVGGIYREIIRPERLVFTWKWETGHPMGRFGR